MTRGFDHGAILQERAHQELATDDAGGGTAEAIMGSSQGSAVDASSAPAGRAKTAETTGSSQGRTFDASQASADRAESDPGPPSASDTDQWNGEDPPVILSGRETHELSNW